MTYGEYQVTGQRSYRGHRTGTRFHARLDRNAEARAISRGDITLLRRIKPTVKPGSFRFPDGWLPPPETDVSPVNRGRASGLSH